MCSDRAKPHEISFKIEKEWVSVEYHHMLTETVMMDSLQIFVERKTSHLKFHRQKFKPLLKLSATIYLLTILKDILIFASLFLGSVGWEFWTAFIRSMNVIAHMWWDTFQIVSFSPLDYNFYVLSSGNLIFWYFDCNSKLDLWAQILALTQSSV